MASWEARFVSHVGGPWLSRPGLHAGQRVVDDLTCDKLMRCQAGACLVQRPLPLALDGRIDLVGLGRPSLQPLTLCLV